MSSLVRLAAGILAAIAGVHAHAGTYSGILSDDTTGAIPAGVHTVTGQSQVPAGKTLTIHPSAVLKFTGPFQLAVDGQLLVNGGPANPVIFTSITDDTAGGDTDGTGPSNGTPGQWRGIVLNGNSSGTSIQYADIRYAGSGGFSGIYFGGAATNVSIANCTIRNGSTYGIDFNANAVNAAISNNLIDGHGLHAVEQATLASLAGFTGNVAINNGGDFVRVTNPALGANLTLGPANGLNGVIVIDNFASIASGVTLTLNAGLVLKFGANYHLQANGVLDVNGVAGNPVVFTSYTDDTAGGDTNDDGPSSGAAGYWRGIVLGVGADGSTLDHADVRFTGSGGFSAVYFSAPVAGVALRDCVLRDGSVHAIDFNGHAAQAAVEDCSFQDNAGIAVQDLVLASLAGFDGNVASGNGGDYPRVISATLSTPLSLHAGSGLNGVIGIDAFASIAAGGDLTLGAGVVLKFGNNHHLAVNGKLTANGTIAQPVVFTTLSDDSAGGDSDSNGPSSGVPGQWRGLQFNSGAVAVLDHAHVRYSGSGGFSAVYFGSGSADVTLTSCVLAQGSVHGIDFNGHPATPTVANCSITGHGQHAVEDASLAAIQNFSNNTATGNGGDYIHVDVGSLTADVTLTKDVMIGDAIVVGDFLSVPTGRTLTLGPGIRFKFTGVYHLDVNGVLNVVGTVADPIVMTSFSDDSVGGDTNLNGPSAGSPGQWRGIALNSGAAGQVRFALLRYPGSSAFAGVRCDSANVALQAIRVEHGSAQGFHLSAAQSQATDLVAWNCATNGITLNGGNFTLRRATAAGCGGVGIQRAAGFTGFLNGCVAFANTGGNLVNADPAKTFYSNGSAAAAGMNGNVNQDPLFENLAQGRLAPTLGSPCIDAGDPADIPSHVVDLDNMPRFLDGDLDGFERVDMGAYEFDHVRLTITGNPAPGGVITLAGTGTAGMSTFLFLGDTPGHVNLSPIGPIFLDFTEAWTFIGWAPLPHAIPLPIPAFFPTPQPVVFQLVAVNPQNRGNSSNAVVVTIE